LLTPDVLTDGGTAEAAPYDDRRRTALPQLEREPFRRAKPSTSSRRSSPRSARRPRIVTAGAHDRLLAFLSHLPQLTASALMQVVGDAVGQEGLALAGRGLADTTRLAASPPDIWRDIAATNADEIGPALDALIALLQELRRDLPEGERLADVLHRRRPLACDAQASAARLR
jgi:hypothetical protein